MEQLSLFDQPEQQNNREWLVKWGTEHNYPYIRFIFGIKGYAFIREDEYVYSQPTQEGWERFRDAPDMFVNLAYKVVRLNLFEIYQDGTWTINC